MLFQLKKLFNMPNGSTRVLPGWCMYVFPRRSAHMHTNKPEYKMKRVEKGCTEREERNQKERVIKTRCRSCMSTHLTGNHIKGKHPISPFFPCDRLYFKNIISKRKTFADKHLCASLCCNTSSGNFF